MTERTCPHGVPIGPLDDYNVPADERVYSTYCAECYRDQTGSYPPEVLIDPERGWQRDESYEWPAGEVSGGD